MGRRDEQLLEVDPLIIGWSIWDFFKDQESGVFVARKRGDEDRPYVAENCEDLRERIKQLYG